ncbi:MAG TPA: phosphoribosylamine--glycine ligase [Verrucomicrobiae bacterium]|nr:phosphoribosylamine--glycine ligase [Verrucomicrobiae bacterium]
MRILVVGSGGREHALVWKIAQSPHVTRLVCAPGNPGIADLAECVPIAATDVDRLAAFARENEIDLTVVGPEAPLCAGIADVFQSGGLRVFGPTRRAAQLEGSKVFCKRMLLKCGIPTAHADVFADAQRARDYLRQCGAPIVVKADGLAAGKGVVVARTIAEADQAIAEIMERRVFGDAGAQVVIEECLTGEEASVMALVDGATVRVLASSQDHKRAWDGDRGPNTGGMGAYSPTPAVGAELSGAIDDIFTRTLEGLRAEGIEYRGVLYAGLMLTNDGPKVLEFNCRFGDPETQAVVPRMDFDLASAASATADGRLGELELKWKPEPAVCVVMASGGYPGTFERGRPIEGLKAASELANVTVFHAGTKRGAGGGIVTDGGRVLGVTALGADVERAARRAYEAVERIHFDGGYFRRDIAARAIRK